MKQVQRRRRIMEAEEEKKTAVKDKQTSKTWENKKVNKRCWELFIIYLLPVTASHLVRVCVFVTEQHPASLSLQSGHTGRVNEVWAAYYGDSRGHGLKRDDMAAHPSGSALGFGPWRPSDVLATRRRFMLRLFITAFHSNGELCKSDKQLESSTSTFN